MKVKVEYDEYNTKMVKAIIPVSEETSYSLEVITETEGSEEDIIEKEKLVISCVNNITNDKTELSMTKSDVREFVTLLNNFRNSMK